MTLKAKWDKLPIANLQRQTWLFIDGSMFEIVKFETGKYVSGNAKNEQIINNYLKRINYGIKNTVTENGVSQ